MASIQQSIEVDVPVRTAYDHWTRFEDFPRFMDAVQQVRQVDDTHLHWVAEAGGKHEEWDAEITEQIPDERVAWRSTSGHRNAGVVTFHRLEERRTRVTVQMEHEAHGVVESVGAALGFDDRVVKRDLARFKEIVEADSADTDDGRHEVRDEPAGRSGPDAEPPADSPRPSEVESDFVGEAAPRDDDGATGSFHHPLI